MKLCITQSTPQFPVWFPISLNSQTLSSKQVKIHPPWQSPCSSVRTIRVGLSSPLPINFDFKILNLKQINAFAIAYFLHILILWWFIEIFMSDLSIGCGNFSSQTNNQLFKNFQFYFLCFYHVIELFINIFSIILSRCFVTLK